MSHAKTDTKQSTDKNERSMQTGGVVRCRGEADGGLGRTPEKDFFKYIEFSTNKKNLQILEHRKQRKSSIVGKVFEGDLCWLQIMGLWVISVCYTFLYF